MLYDYIVSAVRTVVPYAVSALIAWGIIPDSLSEPATLFLTGAIFGGYYLLARLLESRWPWLGWLLGKPNAPTYGGRKPSRVIEG